MTFGVGTDASRILTHRIVGVHISAPDEVSYATKGDDNDARDAGLVSSARVLGVYRFKIPGGGYVLDVLRQPMALGLFVLVALRLRRRTANALVATTRGACCFLQPVKCALSKSRRRIGGADNASVTDR